MRFVMVGLAGLLTLGTACAPAPTGAPTAAPSPTTSPAASPAARPAQSPSPAVAPSPAPAASPAAAPGPGTGPSFDEQAVADFYRGKTVTILVGYSPGGGYDLYARLLARHIGRYIPGNPGVIVQNQPGAGSVLSANTLFNTSPRDGTVIGTFARGLPAEELLGREGVQYRSAQFNWIGSMNEETSVCVARTDAPVKKFEDLYTTPLKIGGTGSPPDTDFFPRFLNGLLGTKFELASGYPGGNDINVAMERGEVQGRCGLSWSTVVSTRPQWLEEPKFITILVQMALNKHPDLPDVPLVTDLARTPEERQLMKVVFSRQAMGRPFAAPPGVPPDRVAALRSAFNRALADKQLVQEASRGGETEGVNPVTGEQIEAILAEVFNTPPDLVKRLAELTKD
jgi:tripartite-type tricarboxylate transporter receptor subunit TctC